MQRPAMPTGHINNPVPQRPVRAAGPDRLKSALARRRMEEAREARELKENLRDVFNDE